MIKDLEFTESIDEKEWHSIYDKSVGKHYKVFVEDYLILKHIAELSNKIDKILNEHDIK